MLDDDPTAPVRDHRHVAVPGALGLGIGRRPGRVRRAIARGRRAARPSPARRRGSGGCRRRTGSTRRCRACGREALGAEGEGVRDRGPRGGGRARMLTAIGRVRPGRRTRRDCQGTVTRRPMIGITGRTRIASSIVASTYSSAAGSSLRTGLAQPLVGGGRAQQALPCPGERVGGRLVAGEHQRHQLVAQLAVGQRLAVLVARLEQQREDVVALAARSGARGARGSPRTSGGRAIAEPALHQPARLLAAEVAELGELARRRGRGVAAAAGSCRAAASALPARGLALDAEDPGHDHVERDRLHPRRERERLPTGQRSISRSAASAIIST